MRIIFRFSLAALGVSALFFAPAAMWVAPSSAAEQPSCKVPSDLSRLEQPLPHTSQRLVAGEPLKIVAIGSSSTAGAGASSPAASYPNRLAAELSAKFPDERITVINRGINGQDAREMLARLEEDVIADKPDLVVWQLGTNAALRDASLEQVGRMIEQGLQQLRDANIDVVLVDPQFVPRVIAKPEAEAMVSLISTTAKTHRVGVFHRFAIMRHWRDAGVSFDAFTSPDNLHMNDWGYACWAKLLSASIVDAAMRPTAAHAGPGLLRPKKPPTQ